MAANNWNVYNAILIPALQMFLDTCEIGVRVDTSRLGELRIEFQGKMADLQQKLASMVRDGAKLQLAAVQESLAKVLQLRQANDSNQLEARETEIKARMSIIQSWLDGADSFNPSSIKDARYLIHDILGIASEGDSTSRTALEDYKDVEGVQLLLRFRENKKLLGTYIEGLVDDLIEDDQGQAVIHPNIRLNGTVTGRLSSNSPNLFGIPDEKGGIKKLYKARYDGWGIGDGDGAQMEVRALGALANDRDMIEAFKAGVDFHGAARNRLYGRGFSKSNYNHQEVLDAKTAVFGPIYGRGPESLAKQFYHSEVAMLKEAGKAIRWPTWESLPRIEQQNRILKAQEHIDKLWAPYPTSLNWLKANVAKAQEDGELQSYYGRVRHWGLITEDTLEDIKTAGRNFPVQSASSDTNLLIMIGSSKEFSRDYYIPIFPVHDAIVFMYKFGTESWLIPQLRAYYEQRARDLLHTDMPLRYSFTTGPNWGEQREWED
jgi:DNA polymerase-1